MSTETIILSQPAGLDTFCCQTSRCDELGICQGGDNCSCQAAHEVTDTPPEAGNVWFVGDEPHEPMTPADRLALGALLLASAATAIGMLSWVIGYLRG